MILKKIWVGVLFFIMSSWLYAEEMYDTIYALNIPVFTILTTDSVEPCFTFENGTLTDNEYVTGRLTIELNHDTLFESGEYVQGESGIKIKVRGNSSAAMPQKPFKIKLSKKDNLLKCLGVEGSKNKEWLLIPASLKTVIGMNVNHLVGLEWTPRSHFVNVNMNGVYRGFYLLIESVTKDNSRCAISDDGFIIENDAYWESEDWFFRTHLQEIDSVFGYTFKYPDGDDLDSSKVLCIQKYMNQVESHLSTPCCVLNDYLDVTTFAAWELAHDILGSLDNWGSNMFLYVDSFSTDTSSKLKMGPIWDMDGIFGTTDEWANIHITYYFGPHWHSVCLNKKQQFVESYKNTYKQIRDKLEMITPQLRDSLYSVESDIVTSISLNEQKNGWVVMNDYYELLETSEQWFHDRVQWMDSVLTEWSFSDGEPVVNSLSYLKGCDSVFYDNHYVKETGLYIDTLSTWLGCDSIVPTQIEIYKSSRDTFFVTQCDEFTWRNVRYLQSGVYSDTLQSQYGCDSILTLSLILHHTAYDTVHYVACDSFLWRNKTYRQTGVYNDTLSTMFGCDSISTLLLTVYPTKRDTLYEEVCDSFVWNEKIYHASGVYTDTFQTVEGCDSLSTLVLKVHKSVHTYLEGFSCEVYMWNDSVYTESGTYTQQFLTTNGCDSLVTIHLEVYYPNRVELMDSCEWNEDYQKYGFMIPFETIAEVKNYTFYQDLQNQYGCDSTVVLTLHTKEEPIVMNFKGTDTTLYCAGDTFSLWYDVSKGSPLLCQLQLTGQNKVADTLGVTKDDLSGYVSIELPQTIQSGDYTATIYLQGIETISNVEQMNFHVGLPTQLIQEVQNNQLICTSLPDPVVSYQWVKNEDVLWGRTAPCLYEEEGVNGVYSCRVTLFDGRQDFVCPSYFYHPTETVSMLMSPNPANSEEAIEIILTGLTNEELASSSMLVFDANGWLNLNRKPLQIRNYITLPAGEFIVEILSNGEKLFSKKLLVR